MTDKITLEFTLDELKTLDKYIEYTEETKSVFDKIKDVYPQLKMTPQDEGEYAVVSYNDTTYYRLMNETTFSWYMIIGYSARTLVMVIDRETERLLEGLYYNHIEVKKQKEPEDNEWKSVALRLGEKLSDTGPGGYYDFSAGEWLEWALNECEKEESNTFAPKEIEELVRESVKWCEDHPNENPLDWLTPKTPEETEESLKEAFREGLKQVEKMKEVQKKIDEEDNDKNFKKSLDLIKEWGEKNKPKTLYEICMEWWDEVFVNQMDDNICVDVLVSKIDKEFIPPSSERNGYEWEKCLKIMRDKLR